MLRRYFIFVMILAIVCVLPKTASASSGLSLSPSKISFETPRGFKETRDLRIENSSTEPIAVEAVLETAHNSKERAKDDAFSPGWLKIAPSRFKLAPGEVVLAKLTLSVPENAGSKGYTALAIFKVRSLSDTNISIESRVASTVQISVIDKGSSSYQVLGFTAPRLNAGDQLEFNVDVKNTGAKPYQTQGKLLIKDRANKVVSEIELPSVEVAPGAVEELSLESFNTLPTGVYTCSMVVSDDGIFKGPYTQSMIVFPWVGTLGFAILGVGLFMLLRKKQHAEPLQHRIEELTA